MTTPSPFARWTAWRRRRASLRALSRLDPGVLRDLGLGHLAAPRPPSVHWLCPLCPPPGGRP